MLDMVEALHLEEPQKEVRQVQTDPGEKTLQELKGRNQSFVGEEALLVVDAVDDVVADIQEVQL